MGRTFITWIALAAFLAVELMAVQTSEAQRLRNLLRRNNNNCNNCCNGCGVPSDSTGSSIAESSATVSDGYVSSSQAISSSEGVVFSESPISSGYAGEIVSSPIMSAPTETYAQPAVSAPMQTYSEPIVNAPMESYSEPMVQMATGSFIAPQPQPYIESAPQFPSESIVEGTPYVEGMPTSEYPIANASYNSYVAPASYEMAANDFNNIEGCVGCGAGAEQASWGYDGVGIQGGIVSDTNIMADAVVMAGETSGQVLGCTTGDCGGQSFDSGQIIDGGQVVGGSGQVITSEGTPIDGSVIYGGSTGFVGGSAEQIISSEIISETPIEASDSTGTPEVTSPVESAPESDQVPAAPEEDGKEA